MRYIAIDLETQGLEAKHDTHKLIHCVGFAERKEGEVVSNCYDWKTGKYVLEQLLNDENVIFLIHNASFDVAVLRTHGVTIPAGRYFCTLLAAYLTRPGLGHSLDDWGEKLGHNKLEYKGGWDECTEEMLTYCKRDTEVCLLLWEYLWNNEYSKDKKLRNVYFNLELPYVEVIIELEGTGLHVDVEQLTLFRADLQRHLDTLNEELRQFAPTVPELRWCSSTKQYIAKPCEYGKGYHKNKNNALSHYTFDGKLWSSEPSMVYNHCKLLPFNPNSSAHLCWVLMKRGWKPEKFSKKTGEPVTDGETIEALDYPIAKAFTKYGELNKLQGTFVDALLNNFDSYNLVRTGYNQCTTATTRLSSSGTFNAQNLPAHSELGATVRKCVTAPPGYDIVVGDLDGIELRVFAYYIAKYCDDHVMAEALRNGADLHQANADTWGISRKEAKTVIFGTLYGAQAKKISQTMKCTEQEAQVVLDKVHNACPAIKELMNMVFSCCRKRGGYVYTLMGNRCYYPDICNDNKFERLRAERQAFNAIIQGTAAGVNKELMLRAAGVVSKYGARFTFVVHDEVGIYCPSEHTQALLDEINSIYECKDILSTPDWFIPVTATFHKGTDWYDAKNK